MHKIGLFSDPHIGLERRAHTTTGSRKQLKEKLFTTALDVAFKMDAKHTLCGGDLFDKSHNDEVTIMGGLMIARECDVIIGGNHDVPNREGTVCSLEVVAQACNDGTIVEPMMGEALHAIHRLSCDEFADGIGVQVITIPHQSSQELFDEVVDQACNHKADDGLLEIVLMHCNYECGFADNEISLNLTSAQADKLLDRFDYVFMGHEHESRRLKNGRLIIMGNTHPTSFSDISDKFVWYITEDNEVISEKIWSKEDSYKKITADPTMPDLSYIPEFPEAQFIDVEGILSQEEYSGVADFMVKMWAANPNAYMIRNNLKVEESDEVVELGLTEIDNLPAHISEELQDNPELKSTWEYYLAKI